MEGDVAVLECVQAHKNLTLIILPEYVTRHLEIPRNEPRLIEVVAELSAERERVEMAGAVATIARSCAMANWVVLSLVLLMVCKS